MVKRTLFSIILLIFSTVVCSRLTGQEVKPPASFVWIDSTGEGRQVYVYFRIEFILDAKPVAAELSLYASSRYALWVNGHYVNFGPIRSYPRHPYCDTFDIQPYLQAGNNLIAVRVMLNGMETFQLPFHTGAFIAWGKVTGGTKSIDLSTPGAWICRQAEGYHPLAPRFSFAKGPVEVYDARREPDDPNAESIDRSRWKTPVILANQDAYGPLIPRSIAYLTQEEILPKFTVNRLDFQSAEKIYHFDALMDDRIHGNYGANPPVVAYTRIYSPEYREVKVGVSWGNFWLNGEKLTGTADPAKPFRNNVVLKLNPGWNLLFTRQQMLWGSLHTLLALPGNSGLTVSPDKTRGDEISWKMAGPLTQEESALTGDPARPVENPEKLPLKWLSCGPAGGMANPAREICWLNVRKNPVNLYKTTGLNISAGEDQAFVFDFGGITLGRIFIDVEAPEGTIFDLTWSEDLRDSLVTLYKRTQINAVARFISKSGKQHFETFKPYGLRYLQVTVRNHREPVLLGKAGIIRQVYPFQKRGSFECSDPLLNDIWEMGWRSLRACAEDSYIDTPFRERGHYAGDLFPQFALTLATAGDPLLAKHTIRMITDMYEKTYRHEEEVRHADYPVINILVAAWVIRVYKDKEFAGELYPVFSHFLEGCYARKGADGLYHPSRLFFEWIEIDKTATLTSYQTDIYAAYHEMAFLARLLGKPEDAARYERWAAETAAMIREKFWDPGKGNFFDGIKEGKYLETRFPGSSTYPSLWGITTTEQDTRLKEYFADALINIGPPVNRKQLTTPYGGFYALASLYRHGNAALAEEFIRRNWGKMVLEANDLTWEDFNRNDHSTMSHAWSASPTYFLSSEALGVNLGFPLQLNPDTVYILPQSETLQWAKGTVPHPRGAVWVSWRIEGNTLRLEYKVPDGVPVVVKPRGRLSEFYLKMNILE